MKVTGVKEPNGMRARLQGIADGTITAGSTGTFDYKFVQLSHNGVNKKSYFDGVQYYAKNAAIGDSVKFQIIDIDNILGYGANFVVEQFGDKWYIAPDAMEALRLFKSKVVPNLYIRIIYDSTGGTDVDFMCNLFQFLSEREDA